MVGSASGLRAVTCWWVDHEQNAFYKSDLSDHWSALTENVPFTSIRLRDWFLSDKFARSQRSPGRKRTLDLPVRFDLSLAVRALCGRHVACAHQHVELTGGAP